MMASKRAPNDEVVLIVPCSGLGKSYGTVGREAAFEVTERLRPGASTLMPLSLLVMGDDDARFLLAESPAITIDGCKLACASKMAKESGGKVARAFAVMDVHRRHRDLKPQGVAQLNEAGEELARLMAEEIAQEIDRLGVSAPAASGDEGDGDV
jgi:uncharacterized metal-binding protein